MTERAWGKRTGGGVERASAWCRAHEHRRLQALLDAPRRQARAWGALAAALAGGVAAFLAIDHRPGDLGSAFDHLTDRFAGLTPGALAIAGALRWLLLVALVALALVLLRANARRATLAAALLVLVATRSCAAPRSAPHRRRVP